MLGTCESLGVRLKLNSLNPPYTAVVKQPQTRRRSRGRTKELGPGPGVGLLSLPPTRDERYLVRLGLAGAFLVVLYVLASVACFTDLPRVLLEAASISLGGTEPLPIPRWLQTPAFLGLALEGYQPAAPRELGRLLCGTRTFVIQSGTQPRLRIAFAAADPISVAPSRHMHAAAALACIHRS